MRVVWLLGSLLVLTQSKIFFQEDFDVGWEKRWVTSKFHGAAEGKWRVAAGENGPAEDKGLQTTQPFKWFDISAKFQEEFDNRDRTLVVQFSVRHEQDLECGGGYIKLIPSRNSKGKAFDPLKWGGESEYSLMFGPDICGVVKQHVVLAIRRKNEYFPMNREIRCPTDSLSHLYTLAIRSNNTYEIRIDQEAVHEGNLEDDFELLPPKTIDDKSVPKPAEWDDREFVNDDQENPKPEGFDDRPIRIVDPQASKPKAWDDSIDGQWDPPTIENPAIYDWAPMLVPNPNFQGKWIAPQLPNPEYKYDPTLYRLGPIGYVGFELWQVEAGTILDHIVVADAESDAAEWAHKRFLPSQNKERTKWEERMRVRNAERSRRQEEEVAAAREAEWAEDEEESPPTSEPEPRHSEEL
mmetsp:Transcript_1640/g.3264  ORF Transcript_1640/g.3264 Transcript_1640/m.3264 type:complete len:409 (+) Transcript_1640:1-1227(+)